MKKMVLSILLVVLLVGCGSTGESDKPNDSEIHNPGNEEIIQGGIETPITDVAWEELRTDSDLETIIMGLYTESDLDSDFIESLSNFHMVTTLSKTDEKSQEVYFGDAYDFVEAKISESGISTSAYSLMLIRANQQSDAQTLSQSIKSTVNPNKWICVTAESVVAASNKDLVLVIMGDEAVTQALLDTFKRLP